ncbi:response regulator [Actinophytocola sp.]|uniref:response regulator n=1 Tax=Actinophytocola sp. TaxID=1872138 RepID=UPI002ED63030
MILIVDDLLVNREVLRTILSSRGHRVLEAHDGAEALVTVGEEMPDLVVTDIVMPGMNGYQLVRELCSKPETTRLPVIFATANFVELEVMPLARAYGVRHVLTKADSLEKLCAAVEAELGGCVSPQSAAINEIGSPAD